MQLTIGMACNAINHSLIQQINKSNQIKSINHSSDPMKSNQINQSVNQINSNQVNQSF